MPQMPARKAGDGSSRRSLKSEIQPHGMNLINFTLTEHLLEDKINQAAKEMVAKTE